VPFAPAGQPRCGHTSEGSCEHYLWDRATERLACDAGRRARRARTRLLSADLVGSPRRPPHMAKDVLGAAVTPRGHRGVPLAGDEPACSSVWCEARRIGSNLLADERPELRKALPQKLSHPRSAACEWLRSDGTGHRMAGVWRPWAWPGWAAGAKRPGLASRRRRPRGPGSPRRARAHLRPGSVRSAPVADASPQSGQVHRNTHS
jgi:hypothetical protein